MEKLITGRSDLRITLVQTMMQWENIDENLMHFASIINAMDEHTDIVVLPEMFSTGFSMHADVLAEEMYGKTMQWMSVLSKKINAALTGSIIIREDEKFYNRLIWMRPDGTFEFYDKRHMFGMAGEENFYTAGKSRLLTTLKGWNICPLICYDLRFPAWCRNSIFTFEKKGYGSKEVPEPLYDVLIFVANWPERRNFAWKHLLQARAIENQCYVAGVNRIGNDGNNIYHSGDSALIDPLGEVLFTKADSPFVKTFILSAERLNYVREKMPFLEDADELDIRP